MDSSYRVLSLLHVLDPEGMVPLLCHQLVHGAADLDYGHWHAQAAFSLLLGLYHVVPQHAHTLAFDHHLFTVRALWQPCEQGGA